MPRGRPKKGSKIPLAAMVNRSAFQIGQFGIEQDKTKDYRWVDPKRIEERKYNDGYELVTTEAAPTSDKTIRTKGNMVLMARSKDRAVESEKAKELRTARQNSATREDFERQVEALSRKYDMDLHRHIKKESGDN